METIAPLASGISVHCAYHVLAPLHELKPRPGNPNEHPEAQLILYAAAIKLRGWRDSIIVSRRSGLIVRGEGGLLAARRLGVEVAPVWYQDYASEEEELADLVAHNRLPELSRTDRDALKSIIARLSPAGQAFSAGFTDDAVAKILADITPAPQYPIVARLNESHHLLCIPVDNETDWQFLKNISGVRIEQSYKNATIGESHVVPFARFLASLRENLHSLAPSRGDDQHS